MWSEGGIRADPPTELLWEIKSKQEVSDVKLKPSPLMGLFIFKEN